MERIILIFIAATVIAMLLTGCYMERTPRHCWQMNTQTGQWIDRCRR